MNVRASESARLNGLQGRVVLDVPACTDFAGIGVRVSGRGGGGGGEGHALPCVLFARLANMGRQRIRQEKRHDVVLP